eukprot:m.240947 g.240947  ORF g.240947 m.240947 type:complete len:132 (-) comp16630_c0_seq1:167-562(-)
MDTVLVNKEDECDAPILREDQDMINEFARLNNRKGGVVRDIELLEQQLEGFSDASDEISLADEDNVRVKVGECFFVVDEDNATSILEGMEEKVRADHDAKKEQLEELKQRMSALKASLYAKFGKSIYLEDS